MRFVVRTGHSHKTITKATNFVAAWIYAKALSIYLIFIPCFVCVCVYRRLSYLLKFALPRLATVHNVYENVYWSNWKDNALRIGHHPKKRSKSAAFPSTYCLRWFNGSFACAVMKPFICIHMLQSHYVIWLSIEWGARTPARRKKIYSIIIWITKLFIYFLLWNGKIDTRSGKQIIFMHAASSTIKMFISFEHISQTFFIMYVSFVFLRNSNVKKFGCHFRFGEWFQISGTPQDVTYQIVD